MVWRDDVIGTIPPFLVCMCECVCLFDLLSPAIHKLYERIDVEVEAAVRRRMNCAGLTLNAH